MENFLIIIIFIGSIIYKIYSNYKEEIEKAKKRIPHQQTVIPVDTYIEPNFNKERKMMTPSTVTKNKTDNTYISRNYDTITDEIPEEVRKVIASKIQKKSSDPKQEILIQEPFKFDFRQAVIQAAILDRPYQ